MVPLKTWMDSMLSSAIVFLVYLKVMPKFFFNLSR
jgi:hypothetical protein